MKGPWKIAQSHIGGEYVYAVYRLLDVNQADHSGNRERGSGWFGTKIGLRHRWRLQIQYGADTEKRGQARRGDGGGRVKGMEKEERSSREFLLDGTNCFDGSFDLNGGSPAPSEGERAGDEVTISAGRTLSEQQL